MLAERRFVIDAGRKWLTKVNPNPRWVSAELSVDAVVFLASGAADGLAGRFLSVDLNLPDLARRAADIERRDVLQLRFIPDLRAGQAGWFDRGRNRSPSNSGQH